MKTLAALVLAVPAAAMGQVTNTDCTRDYFGNVHCTSRSGGIQMPDMNEANRIFMQSLADTQRRADEQAQQQRALRLQQQQLAMQAQQAAEAERRATMAMKVEQAAEQRAQEAAQLAETQRLEAARLVAAGDCAGAQQYALAQGNFELAQQVKDYCQ
jgi:hypothetical protein